MPDIIGKYKGKLIWKCEKGFYHKNSFLSSSGCLFCEHTNSSTYFDYLNINDLVEIIDENIINVL